MNNALPNALAFYVFIVDSSEWKSVDKPVLPKRSVPDERGVAARRRVPLEYELRETIGIESH